MDYGFYTEAGIKTSEKDIEKLKKHEYRTIMVATDGRTNSICATCVTGKGAKCKYGILKIASWLDRLGYDRVVITTDNEHSVKTFARKVKDKTSVSCVLRTRPKESSQSLASGETSVGIIAAAVRTLVSEVEDRIEQSFPLTNNLVAWAVHHAAWTHSRFKAGSDNTA
jgi:hypothetical protein